MNFTIHKAERRTRILKFSEIIVDVLRDIFAAVTAELLIEKIKPLLRRREKVLTPEVEWEKRYMLTNICRLYEFQQYEIDNPTMDKKMINIMYDLSIELLLRYDVREHCRMEYIASNYSVRTIDRMALINALEDERDNPKRHDSRYLMGFRSVFVLISDNLRQIGREELKQILIRLRPFFDSYSHKDLLNHYAFLESR